SDRRGCGSAPPACCGAASRARRRAQWTRTAIVTVVISARAVIVPPGCAVAHCTGVRGAARRRDAVARAGHVRPVGATGTAARRQGRAARRGSEETSGECTQAATIAEGWLLSPAPRRCHRAHAR